jgi:hypothetical protein
MATETATARAIRLIQEDGAMKERERIARLVERLDNTMMHQDLLAAFIRTSWMERQ